MVNPISPFFFFFLISISLCFNSTVSTTFYNVLNYGAKPNGLTDSTKAFLHTWAQACACTDSATIYVPKGRYLLGSMVFQGACKTTNVKLLINGTLVAQRDYQILGKSNTWFSFQGVNGVSIVGGSMDAKGSSLWDCKTSTTAKNCPTGATTLSFTNSKNIKIKGLLSMNSQLFHIVFNGCKNVNLENNKIMADGNSPNTDGIHVQYSSNIVIYKTRIQTGDDCISIGPGTRNLWIERVRCGPGHGISIGSLAKDSKERGVQNVTVKSSYFANTQNGFRIKSWARRSTGFVRNIRFIGAIMQNVQNPIIIDQHYCPHNLHCPNKVSGIKISDVIYEEIQGTSATAVAIKLDCSSLYPCRGIRMHNVNLTYSNKEAQSSCINALGNTVGLVQPQGCF